MKKNSRWIFVFVFLWTFKVYPSPEISFSTITLDFGELDITKPETKQLTITNAGKDNLIIAKIRPSCKCLTVQTDKRTISKGECAILSVCFDPKDLLTPKEYSLFVETNTNPSLHVIKILAAPIIPKVPLMQVTPNQLYFSFINDTATARLLIKNTGKELLKGVLKLPDNMVASIKSFNISPRQQETITLIIKKPDLPKNDSISIESNASISSMRNINFSIIENKD